MASAYIIRRKTTKGVSYHVKYRLGGRSARVQHAGSFRTLAEARARANWVRGEIAAMRVPDFAPPTATELDALTLPEALQRMIDERPDATAGTKKTWGNCQAVVPVIPVSSFTVERAIKWVADINEKYKPATANSRISTLAVALDHVGLVPNPLRDNRIKRPKLEDPDARPVLDVHWSKIQRELSPENLEQAIVLEQTALRRGELEELEWRDINFDRGTLFVRTGKTKSARRELHLGEYAQGALELLRARQARTGGASTDKVFPDGTGSLASKLYAISKKHGWPAYGPHALRHRRATIWINGGVAPREVSYRLGHKSTQITLDTYTHRTLEETAA